MKALLLVYGPPFLLWLAVAYKLPAWYREPRDAGRRYLLLTLLFLALAITVLIPVVYVGIDRLAGVPNLSRLLSNSLTLLDCWTLLALLAHLGGWTQQGRADVRRSGWFLLLSLVAMAGFFFTAPVPQEALDFVQRYADAPHVLEYRLVYLLYLALAEITLARLAWRYAKVASHPSLRLGLRLLAIGGIAGMAYVINNGGYLMLRHFDLPYPLANFAIVDQTLVAVALGLGAVGSTMPAWGPRVGIPRIYRWVTDYRSLQRLYPLWDGLYRSNPEIAFDAPTSTLTDILSVSDVSFRLYRRVIEIHDGWLALRPYADPRVADLARELCREDNIAGQDADAVVEAASLVAAQWAKAHGKVFDRGSEHSVTFTGGSNMPAEVALLERVAHAYGHSSIVQTIRNQLDLGDNPTATRKASVAEES